MVTDIGQSPLKLKQLLTEDEYRNAQNKYGNCFKASMGAEAIKELFHEIKATLFDVVETARRMLRTSGRFVIIYPAERLPDIIIQMRSAGIEPKYIRMIHSSRQMKAKRILVEGKKASRHGITIGPPLIIYRKNGSYSDEARAMFMA